MHCSAFSKMVALMIAFHIDEHSTVLTQTPALRFE
jgi:hypothetical protein